MEPLVVLAVLPFAVFKLTETVKIATPWPLHALTKALLPFVFATGLVFLVPWGWEERILLVLASTGLAAGYQKVIRYFSYSADERAQRVITEMLPPQRHRAR